MMRKQSNWKSHTLLLGMQNGTDTLGSSLAVSYKIKPVLSILMAMSLLGIYSREMKSYSQKTCT